MASAWDSALLPCQVCTACGFRAERGKETCCATCGRCADEPSDGPPACEDGHESGCPRLEQEVLRQSRWELFRCDVAAEEEAACLVVPPREEIATPAPVILFLTGNGHIDDRQDFFCGGVDQVLRNPGFRRYFVLAPKPLSKTGVLRYNDNWRWAWAEDAVWALFTEVLRRLGPERVDPARLYVTGLSLGAAGTWHLALRYGERLAAAAPIAGRCEWPGESWPRRSGPDPAVLERLTALPLRVYHTDVDHYGGNPVKDVEWLCWQVPETTEDLTLRGMETGRTVDVQIRRFVRDVGACWELCLAKGPLQDWAYYDAYGGDKHCLWQRVYPWPEWGLPDFFSKHTVPSDRCWSFDSPIVVVDTGKEKEKAQAEESSSTGIDHTGNATADDATQDNVTNDEAAKDDVTQEGIKRLRLNGGANGQQQTA